MKFTHKDLTIDRTHPDLAILCRFTGTKPDDLRGTSSSIPGGSISGNYLKDHSVRTWTNMDIEKLKQQIRDANRLTEEYEFEYVGVSDYEVEWDNDRIWPADFRFVSRKKKA